MPLRPIDPLAHRALDALVRAQATLTRRLAADLDRIGVSATGFAMLVLLTSAGGQLELRAMRRRLAASKATATEVLDTLETRGFVIRSRLEDDRRAVSVALTTPAQPRLPTPSPPTRSGCARPSSPSTRARSASSPRSAGSSTGPRSGDQAGWAASAKLAIASYARR